jgi:hypothetical protein
MASGPKHARYTAHHNAICPVCWSQLSWKARVSRDGRGWGLLETDQVITIDGYNHPVSTIRYPCANSTCSATVLTTWATGLVGRDAILPFVHLHQLSADEQRSFDQGTTTRGVWRDVDGLPKAYGLPQPSTSRKQHGEKARQTDSVDRPTRAPRRGKTKSSKLTTRKST